MRVKLLFWNYNTEKGSLMGAEVDKADPLARMAKRLKIDFIILAECNLPNEQILNALGNQGLDFTPLNIPRPHPRVRFFRRTTAPSLIHVNDDERFHFVRLTSPGMEEILIGAVHLYDRMHAPKPGSRRSKAAGHIKTLLEAESLVKHSRTLLVGDFNMTPEEEGMVDPKTFGALLSWDLARIWSSQEPQEPPRFFNPMWALVGRAEAPGTYYWNADDFENTFWYCLDGVIARYSLLGVFRDETLAIIATIPGLDEEEVPLFRPARKHYKIAFSDHLPIRFELQLRPNRAGVTS